jgi:hypothetical protein
MNWTFVFALLWFFYTAFCIGITVGMIGKHLRRQKPPRP